MEGPTPVSALIHAATMVAAGVYLVGRFYPVFAPEVLLVIAYVGCITLFMAATIAITATDIKRVLAYSTVSQLGYMMFSLGVGGWAAGLFHLFTHAFFKALLFLCSGSVIHACHTNEMPEMGGLRKKMPWTAWTMLVGCLAISGAGIPLLIGLSGYYSKDAILAQAFSFAQHTPAQAWLFYVAAGGAAITAFYMFRLWFMTFAGKPRNHHVYDHAHESPASMYVPLVILAFFAVVAGWPLPGLNLPGLLEQARPLGTAEGFCLGGGDLGSGRAARTPVARPRIAPHRIVDRIRHGLDRFCGRGAVLPGPRLQSGNGPQDAFRPSTVSSCTSGSSTSCTTWCSSSRRCSSPSVAAEIDRLVIDRLADGSRETVRHRGPTRRSRRPLCWWIGFVNGLGR